MCMYALILFYSFIETNAVIFYFLLYFLRLLVFQKASSLEPHNLFVRVSFLGLFSVGFQDFSNCYSDSVIVSVLTVLWTQ